MQKTIKDFQRLGSKGQNGLKFALYWGYIPLMLYFGIKTVNWENFTSQQPM